jgi:hypothetical protein
MANTKMRVVIPTNPEDLLKLATAINKKHTEDGAKSPLNSMVDCKWETESPKLPLAQAKHDEAEDYKKKMETAYRERDLIMVNIPKIVRSSRDILTGVNHDNMKRLGEWGFTVESSPAPATKTSKPASK